MFHYNVPPDLPGRVKTAAIALLLTLPVIYWGKKLTFLILISLVTFLSLKEFYLLTKHENKIRFSFLALLNFLLLIWGYFSGISLFEIPGILPVILVLVLASFLFFMFFLSNPFYLSIQSLSTLLTFLSIIYITIPFFLSMIIYSTPRGRYLLMYILSIVWIGDTGAYFIGSNFGKHKLYPAVSPGKTIEGAIGSLIFSIISSLFLKRYLVPELKFNHAVLLGLVISFLSQFGDLSESLIKRKAGVKDSGNLFPGHGGMFDRIDSLLFTIPFVYFYLSFLIPELLMQ